MKSTTGGEIIARMLAQEGVEKVFGIIDGTYFGLYSNFKKLGIELISPRHEACALHINLAGDGALSMREIAAILKKPYLPLPVRLVKSTLWLLRKLRLSQYGPEQVNFLRYRPVLSNQKLKTEFGYVPRKNSQEVFEYYLLTKT